MSNEFPAKIFVSVDDTDLDVCFIATPNISELCAAGSTVRVGRYQLVEVGEVRNRCEFFPDKTPPT